MANLPKPDWITLFESAKRAKRAFSAEQSKVEEALIKAFHDGRIHTSGRCRPYFQNDRLYDLPKYFWDRADVVWQMNKFAIPSHQLGPTRYIVRNVYVCREDLEKWINGAIPDSQHGPQEPAETPSPAQATPVEHPEQSPRKKPAELMHKRWITRAKELRGADKKMKVSEIASKIRREDTQSEDPNTRGETRDKGTIRRVLHARRSEWDIPQES